MYICDGISGEKCIFATVFREKNVYLRRYFGRKMYICDGISGEKCSN